jgi:hypothetical protein
MAKTVCKILGVVLLLVGIAGFLKSDLLMMHLTPIHNIIHLLTAAIALYIGFAGSANAARTFCLVFGAIYLLVGALGFIAPKELANIIGHTMADTDSLTPDNIVHLVLGGVFLLVGLQRAPQPAPTT